MSVPAVWAAMNLAIGTILLGMLFGRRPADRRQNMVKEMQKMLSQLRKGKVPAAPLTTSRTETIASMYSSNMVRAGLQIPSDMVEGTTPSFTQLAQYLRNAGLDEGLVEAMQTGVLEAGSEEDVLAIIDAAAGTPDISLTSEQIQRVKDLAREEWKRGRGSTGG